MRHVEQHKPKYFININQIKTHHTQLNYMITSDQILDCLMKNFKLYCVTVF